MSRQLLLLTILLVLSLSPCNMPQCIQSACSVSPAVASQQPTEVQQQSDHMNRVSKQKEQRENEKQMASIGVTQAESRGLDSFVMIMLVISAGALFFISRRISSRRGKRRRPRSLTLR